MSSGADGPVTLLYSRLHRVLARVSLRVCYTSKHYTLYAHSANLHCPPFQRGLCSVHIADSISGLDVT